MRIPVKQPAVARLSRHKLKHLRVKHHRKLVRPNCQPPAVHAHGHRHLVPHRHRPNSNAARKANVNVANLGVQVARNAGRRAHSIRPAAPVINKRRHHNLQRRVALKPHRAKPRVNRCSALVAAAEHNEPRQQRLPAREQRREHAPVIKHSPHVHRRLVPNKAPQRRSARRPKALKLRHKHSLARHIHNQVLPSRRRAPVIRQPQRHNKPAARIRLVQGIRPAVAQLHPEAPAAAHQRNSVTAAHPANSPAILNNHSALLSNAQRVLPRHVNLIPVAQLKEPANNQLLVLRRLRPSKPRHRVHKHAVRPAVPRVRVGPCSHPNSLSNAHAGNGRHVLVHKAHPHLSHRLGIQLPRLGRVRHKPQPRRPAFLQHHQVPCAAQVNHGAVVQGRVNNAPFIVQPDRQLSRCRNAACRRRITLKGHAVLGHSHRRALGRRQLHLRIPGPAHNLKLAAPGTGAARCPHRLNKRTAPVLRPYWNIHSARLATVHPQHPARKRAQPHLTTNAKRHPRQVLKHRAHKHRRPLALKRQHVALNNNTGDPAVPSTAQARRLAAHSKPAHNNHVKPNNANVAVHRRHVRRPKLP